MTRMKTSTILTRAKRHLSRTTRVGLCSAVWELNHNNGIALHKLTPVTNMIAKRIKPFTYASSWLAWRMTQGYRLPPSEFRIPHGVYHELHDWLSAQGAHAIQDWRHRWLDQMIAEFKAKGD